MRRRAVELSGADLEPVVLNIDAETFLVSSQSYVAGVGSALIEEEFSDYQLVDGVNIAFAASVSQAAGKCSSAASRASDQRAAQSVALPAPVALTLRLMLSCGEPSGDLCGRAHARAQTLAPGVDCRPRRSELCAAGGELLDDYRGIAVTGLTEALRSFEIQQNDVALARWAQDTSDALIVIDSPDFNLRLAAQVRKLSVPIVYYISPQVWAWRAGRMKRS